MVLLARGSVTVTAVNDGVPEKLYRAWSNNADGSGFSTTDSSRKYLGTYVGLSEPTLASQYKWTLIKGETGEPGQPGQPGASAYLHTAWANSANGQTGFSTSVSTDKLYIGTYSNSSSTPSQVYTSYKWVRVKGLDAKFYSVIVDKSFLNRNGLSSTATEKIAINSYVHEGNSAGVAAPGFFIIKEQIKQTTAGVTTYAFQEKHRSTTAVSQFNYTVSANAVTVKIEFYLTNQFNNLFAVRDIGVLMDASTDIEARVPIAQLIENINNHPDTTRISGKRMHFTNEVSFDQSFHTKLFAETGFIENLGAYEFSADNIKTGTLSSANGMSTMNLTTGAFSFAGGKLKYDGTTLSVIGSLTVASFSPDLKTSFDGKLDTTKLATSGQVSIHGGNITAGTLTADKITTGTLDASKVTVENLNATNITAGTLDVGKLTLKNLSASDIQAGTLDASKVTVKNLNATNITAGTLDVGILNLKNLSADDMQQGTLDANNVSIVNLSASSIKTGTLDASLVNIDKLSANSIKGGSLDLSKGLTISDGVNDILSIGADGKVALNASSIKIGTLPVATKEDVDNIALTPGPQGVSITSVTEWYLVSGADKGITTTTIGWNQTMRTMSSINKYLWNYERINFSDGSTQATLPVIIGVYGATGETGETGATGRSITAISEHYLATASSSGVTRTTSGWTTTMQTTTSEKKYLWNYETITWSSGTITTYVEPIIIGIHGDKGEIGPKGATGSQGPKGDVGTSVESITEHYLATASASGVTTGTAGWTTTIQNMDATKKYLWNYEKVNFSDGTNQPTLPVIIGVYGDKGQTGGTGATGRSITAITEHYLATAVASGVTRATSGWSTTMQPTTPTNKYLWNYETITWSSGTTTTYVEPIIIGIHGEQGPQGVQGPQGATGATGARGPQGNTGTSVSSVVEYYLATSSATGVTTATTGWGTTMQPMTTSNKYLWNYELINFSDGSTQPTIPVIIGVHGATGGTGLTGATGRSITAISEHYLATASASGVTRSTSGWTTTMQTTTSDKKYLWNFETITWSSGTITTYVEPIIIGIHGEQGPQGAKGATGERGPQGAVGVSVQSITEYYLATSAATGVTTGTAGWTTTMQPMDTTKKYLWNYELIKFSDNSTQPTIPVIIGVHGATGATGGTGSTGATGRSITGITEHYLATSAASGVTRATSGWSTNMKSTTTTNKYLWNYETITWSSGTTPTYVEPIIIGIHGETGAQGAQGVSITKVDVEYYLSTSNTSLAGGGWSTTAPAWIDGRYMWSRTITTYSSGLPTESLPVCITGAKGSTGSTGGTGATGRGITSIVEQFYLSDSKTTQTGGAWSTTMPTWSVGKYVWTRSYITYTTGTPATGTTTPLVSSEWEAVNEIEVGGVNLLKNSNFKNALAGWSVNGTVAPLTVDGRSVARITNTTVAGFYAYPTKLVSGSIYTISFDARSISGTSVLRVGFLNESANRSQTFSFNTIWKRYSYTIAAPIVNETQYFHFYSSGPTIGTGAYITNIQLEKGNKATDWTTAPEDIEAAYTAVAQAKAEAERVKAETYADGKVTIEEQARIADANAKLTAAKQYAVDQILADKTIKDTRNDNQTPAWYYTNHPRRTIKEFKLTSVIGVVSSEGTYGILETEIPWNDASGGPIKQTFRVNSKTFKRSGTTTSWSSWVSYDDIAEKAKSDAATAKGIADGAATSASTANSLLTDIASDSKLTATEKKAAKKEWDIIVGEKPKIDSSANTYGITTQKTAYNTAYNALNTYLSSLLANLSITSNIVGTTFRTNFKNYYNARQDLLNAISDGAKSLVDKIEIGGVNLLRQNSWGSYSSYNTTPTQEGNVITFKKVNTNASTAVSNISIPYGADVVYTASGIAKINGVPVTNSTWGGYKGLSTYQGEVLSFQIDGTTGRFVITQKWTSNSQWLLHGGIFTSALNSIITIENFQLEKGNKATNWSPAPEDVAVDINKKTYNPVRYIRDWSNGSTANSGNHWYELMAIDEYGNNKALSKTVTTNGTATNLAQLVNGAVPGTTYASATNNNNPVYVQVDLGSIHYNIVEIKVWKYYNDGRTYNDNKTEVSSDGVTWYPIYDYTVEGNYIPTQDGKTIPNTIAKTHSILTGTGTKNIIDQKADQSGTSDILKSIQDALDIALQEKTAAGLQNELSEFIKNYNTKQAAEALEKVASEKRIKDIEGRDVLTDIHYGEMTAVKTFIDRTFYEGEEGLMIKNGKEGTHILINDEEISFFSDGTKTAYISQNKLSISDGTFIENLQIGNISASNETSKNHLTFRYTPPS